MKFSVRQVFVAFTSLVLTLGVLFVGERIYHTAVVQTPLIAHVGAVKGVDHVAINGSTVTIHVIPGSNLMAVYQNVVKRATTTLGHSPHQVIVVGHSDSRLSQLANNVAFMVAQGEATGDFVAMKNSIQSAATKVGVSVAEQMDNYHLYLTFQTDHHVLYDVLPITIGGYDHG